MTYPGPGGTRVAAFFDLDKTIIAKSSTLAFSRPFFQEGLINRRAVLKSSYAQFMFLLAGADTEQMERMRAHITA
ncbi:MAG: HAD-IB family hydrolase, partial [Actinomycetes bacterium]